MTTPRQDPRDPQSGASATGPDTHTFGTTGGRARLLRLLVAAVLLGVAVTLTYRYSRQSEVDAPAAGHAHGAGPAATAQEPIYLDDRAERRIGVTFAAVTQDRLAQEVRTVAQVTYDETRVRAIAPKIDGWVEQLHLNFTGQPVAIGDTLLTIYSPMLVSAQQELLLAVRLEQGMSQAEPSARRGAQELRDAARRRLEYWDISDEQIRELERTGVITKSLMLRSPVNGVVVEKSVLAGQRIMAGEPLYKVADLSIVWLEGEVFERDLGAVRLGQRVRAEFDAFPGASRSGRVTYIYPTLNPDTRTARIRVEIPNRDLQLKPGMYGTIRIDGALSAPTLVVPRSAVLATGERRLVFVRRADGKLEPRDVEIGRSSDDFTQILRGLAFGDTVVRSATFLVDAESNLSSALGGMGAMPGMDMAPPSGGSAGAAPAPGARPRAGATPRDSSAHAGAHQER